jgi:hypothetical protein
MIEFFQWIASLEPPLAWGLFVILAGIMAVVPFAGRWLKALKIKFANEQAEILDFSWRIIPEIKMSSNYDKQYYITNSESPVLYEGMIVLICWHVTGAYRIDVEPLGRDLKGNNARVVIKKGKNRYLLTAHTWKGKLKRELELPSQPVRTLQTFNISHEDHFGQPHSELATTEIASTRYKGFLFSRFGLQKLKAVLLKRIYSGKNRVYAATGRIEYATGLNEEKKATQSFLESQSIIKTYTFKPGAYNRALEDYKNNQ